MHILRCVGSPRTGEEERVGTHDRAVRVVTYYRGTVTKKAGQAKAGTPAAGRGTSGANPQDIHPRQFPSGMGKRRGMGRYARHVRRRAPCFRYARAVVLGAFWMFLAFFSSLYHGPSYQVRPQVVYAAY